MLASNVEKEPASAAISILDELPYMFMHNPQESEQRWAVEMPMARKMLFITNDNEDVINIYKGLQLSQQASKPPYINGNLVDREIVFNFFLVENQDRQICDGYKRRYL